MRSVPLVAQLAGPLRELQERRDTVGPDDPVFCNEIGERLDGTALRRRFIAARDRAGLRPLRLHGLRHTFASLAISVPRQWRCRRGRGIAMPGQRRATRITSPGATRRKDWHKRSVLSPNHPTVRPELLPSAPVARSFGQYSARPELVDVGPSPGHETARAPVRRLVVS